MPSGLSGAIDRRIEGFLVAWLRRERPVLRVVPARWIRPVVAPTARRLRRSLNRTALVAAMSACVVLGLLALKP
jgi:hypothetical protein